MYIPSLLLALLAPLYHSELAPASSAPHSPPPSLHKANGALHRRQMPLWNPIGCVTDSPARALTGATTASVTMTVEACTSFCYAASFTYAGLEDGNQCYCGDDLLNGAGVTAPDSSCNMPCVGNAAEICGASYFMNLYYLVNVPVTISTAQTVAPVTPTLVVAPTLTVPTIPTTTAPAAVTAPVTATAPAAAATTVGSADGWTSLGCVIDVALHTLNSNFTYTGLNTVEYCQAFCSPYVYAGVEDSSQCYCGNALLNGGGAATLATNCNMACIGNLAEICGGVGFMNLYSHVPVAAAAGTTLSIPSTTPAAAATTPAAAATTPSASGASSTAAGATTSVSWVTSMPSASATAKTSSASARTEGCSRTVLLFLSGFVLSSVWVL